MNKFGISLRADYRLSFLLPPEPGAPISRADALELAAWLLLLNGITEGTDPRLADALDRAFSGSFDDDELGDLHARRAGALEDGER